MAKQTPYNFKYLPTGNSNSTTQDNVTPAVGGTSSFENRLNAYYKQTVPSQDTANVSSLNNSPHISDVTKAIMMPEVTTEANKGYDFPTFDSFKQKYGLGSTFGFDKLPQFYDKATSLNDQEAVNDYHNVVDSIKNTIGTKALYSALNLQNQSIVNDEAIKRQNHLQTISDTMQGLVTGEGLPPLYKALNPFVGIVGGLNDAQKTSQAGIDAWDKGDKLGGAAEMLLSGMEAYFPIAMSQAASGLGIMGGQALAQQIFPNQSKWLSPITQLTKPTSAFGKSMAAFGDMATWMGASALAESFLPLKGKITPEAEQTIADNMKQHIQDQMSKEPFKPEQELNALRSRYSDLGNQVNDTQKQLDKLNANKERVKGSKQLDNLNKKINDLTAKHEDMIAERDAINESLKPFYRQLPQNAGFTQVDNPSLPKLSSEDITGQNTPINVNWAKAINPDLVDRLTGGGRYDYTGKSTISPEQGHPIFRSKVPPEMKSQLTKADIPFSYVDNILEFNNGAKIIFGKNGEVLAGISSDGNIVHAGSIDLKNSAHPEQATENVLKTKVDILQQSLDKVPSDQDKEAIQNEIQSTNKELDNLKNTQGNVSNPEIQTEIGQGSTIDNKSIQSTTQQKNVQPVASNEGFQRVLPLTSDENGYKNIIENNDARYDGLQGDNVLFTNNKTGGTFSIPKDKLTDTSVKGMLSNDKNPLLKEPLPQKATQQELTKAFGQTKSAGTGGSPLDNKPITDEMYWDADKYQRSVVGRLSSNPFLDPKYYESVFIKAAYHIQNGVTRFSEFTKKMIDEFGDNVKPYLFGMWQDLQANPTLTQIAKEEVPFNPTQNKFNNSKPVKAIVGTLNGISDAVSGTFQSAFPVIDKYGDNPYANVMEGVHKFDKARFEFNKAKSEIFDGNFDDMRKFFNKFTPEQIKIFNNTFGTAKFDVGKEVQAAAFEQLKTLPKELQDPRLYDALNEMSKWVHNWAQSEGMQLDEVKDYFYGSFKNGIAVNRFFDYWKTTDKYTKEKQLPTIADATGWGLKNKINMELKNINPVDNRAEELYAIARRVGLIHVDKFNTDTNAPYMVDKNTATEERMNDAVNNKWQPINDPVFKDKLFDPTYARFVNNMIEVNKISANPFLRTLRGIGYTAQMIKFAGSMFHFVNMIKHSVAAETGGVFNYNGYKNFLDAFNKYDENDPKLSEYIGLGGDVRYSLSSTTQRMLTDNISKLADKLGVTDDMRKLYGKTKFIPVSPENIKWLYNDFIPTLKFNRWKMDVANAEERLGRELTNGEKIAEIRKIQQFYGEMNERLYGRSGTVTSALRLLFLAPGYGEGNLRTTMSSLDWHGAANKDAINPSRENLKYVVNSLVTSLVMASTATWALTGKPPDIPKTAEDVRDLFKVKTGMKDNNGNDLYVDIMTYDKDFWAIYGDTFTGQFRNIPTDLMTRVSAAVSPVMSALTDMSSLFEGKPLYDYTGHPIYDVNDDFLTKMSKFMMHESGLVMPISLSIMQDAMNKGGSLPHSILNAMIGVRPVYSERTKRIKVAIHDTFQMRDARSIMQSKVDKDYITNPQIAIKEVMDFNAKQKAKIEKIGKELNLPVGDYNKFLIKGIHPQQPATYDNKLQHYINPPRKAIR